VLLSWHIAETREQARREAGAGLMRWHNEYNVGTLRGRACSRSLRPRMPWRRPPAAKVRLHIGTPDDLVKTIKSLMEVSGGVGTIVGFVHDWANPENTRRSWDMVARYVCRKSTASSTLAQIAEIRDREPRGVRARRPGRDGEDHGERQGRGSASADGPDASRFRPSTRRICRRKPPSRRRDASGAARSLSTPLHSITSSAVASIDGGTVMPSAVAV